MRYCNNRHKAGNNDDDDKLEVEELLEEMTRIKMMAIWLISSAISSWCKHTSAAAAAILDDYNFISAAQ